eukprot:3359661-Pyramimonas_sp.AAC.1
MQCKAVMCFNAALDYVTGVCLTQSAVSSVTECVHLRGRVCSMLLNALLICAMHYQLAHRISIWIIEAVTS